MSRRVVVTGLGAVTPIGLNVNDFWAGVKEGKTGFCTISKFDATEFKASVAAEIKDFVGKEHMDAKVAKRSELFVQYAIVAAGEAIADAKLDMEKEDPYMVGCSIGNGVGSMQANEREYERLQKGPSKVSPLYIPMLISNMAAGNVSIQYGLKGKNIDVVTACASGTNSIGEAFRAIQYGDADVMIAGGTEAAICPLGVAGFNALNALSTEEDPAKASLPFDKDRSGFVMGEGAGIAVLEELEHAKKRGAKIYAEVIGYGCSADAFHITSPAEDGAGAAKAMENALKDGGIAKEDLTYINAHGTATHMNDLFETRAIKLLFGDHAKNLRINSTKSMVGHLLGAAGGVEFITCVKEVEEGFIHKTVGYKTPDEEMDLDYCQNAYEEEVPYALSNSLGFGGHNASILIKKYAE